MSAIVLYLVAAGIGLVVGGTVLAASLWLRFRALQARRRRFAAELRALESSALAQGLRPHPALRATLLSPRSGEAADRFGPLSRRRERGGESAVGTGPQAVGARQSAGLRYIDRLPDRADPDWEQG